MEGDGWYAGMAQTLGGRRQEGVEFVVELEDEVGKVLADGTRLPAELDHHGVPHLGLFAQQEA